jgi:glycosyltransferase involved in cell wall biosynthesis
MAGTTPVQYHPNPGELVANPGKLVADQSQAVGVPALQLKPGFNVVFAGNMGTVQALDTVLDAAELLQRHEDVHVVLVGSGSRSEWLQHEVARRRLRNVQTPGRFPPEAMPGILAQASVLLVSLVRSPIMSQTVPSKMQAYLAAGKAIIGSLDGEGARLLNESGAGLACAAEDGPALAAAVLRLRALSPDALQRMGEAGERYYRQNFDPDILAAKLVKHFSQVLAGCRR